MTYSKGDFPLLDFATTTNFSTWEPLKANVMIIDGSYCANIETKSGIVFPIALTSDWETRNSLFAGNKHIQNSLYFLAALMFLLFLLNFIFLFLHFTINCDFSLPKISLFLLCIYSGLRGVYFLLFALGKLDNISNKNPAGFFVLAELPYYVFLSIFIVLVIFWVKNIFFLKFAFYFVLFLFFFIINFILWFILCLFFFFILILLILLFNFILF